MFSTANLFIKNKRITPANKQLINKIITETPNNPCQHGKTHAIPAIFALYLFLLNKHNALCMSKIRRSFALQSTFKHHIL
jgi:hypothetical protein